MSESESKQPSQALWGRIIIGLGIIALEVVVGYLVNVLASHPPVLITSYALPLTITLVYIVLVSTIVYEAFKNTPHLPLPRRVLAGMTIVWLILTVISVAAPRGFSLQQQPPTAKSAPSPTAASSPTERPSSPSSSKFESAWTDSHNSSSEGCGITSAGDLQFTTATTFRQNSKEFEVYCYAPQTVADKINNANVKVTFTVALQVMSDVSGPGSFRYGIVFRDNGADKFFFNMHSNGQWYVTEIATGTRLAQSTIPNFDIKKLHSFSVVFQTPTHYQVLIDGQSLATFPSTKLTDGSIGVSAIDTQTTSTVLATSYSVTLGE